MEDIKKTARGFFNQATVLTNFYSQHCDQSYEHADFDQQEEYVLNWARKLVDAIDPEDEGLQDDLKSYQESLEEFSAVRSYHLYTERGETPLGEKIYTRLLAEHPDKHLDFSLDFQGIEDLVREFRITDFDATHLKVFLEKTFLKNHLGNTTSN